MQFLIQNSLQSDLQSIDNAQYDEQFPKQIQALLEYGMYEKAIQRIMDNKNNIQNNHEEIIFLSRLFNGFKQYKSSLEIIKISNIFDNQLDVKLDIQIALFKQYFVETYIEIENIHTVLRETKQIFNDQVRKIIQDELHIIEGANKNIHHSPLIHTQDRQIQSKQFSLKQDKKKLIIVIGLIFIIFFILIKKREKIKFLLIIIQKWIKEILGL